MRLTVTPLLMSYLVDTDWVIDYLLGDATARTLLSSLTGLQRL